MLALPSRTRVLAAALAAAGAAGCREKGGAAASVGVTPAQIIDSHIHLYDPTRPIPAGRDRPIPWPPPTDSALYHTFLPADYLSAARPMGIVGAVVIEASSWLEDNQWILDLAAQQPVIAGYIGDLEEVLGKTEFNATLERLMGNPLFRGIRSSPEQALSTAAMLASFQHLGEVGMVLDTLSGAAETTRLAKRVPKLRIVLDHMARLDIRNPAPTWFNDVAAAAQQPNVFMKVSGLAEFATPPTDPESYRQFLDHVFQVFGEDRVMYGTDWPVAAQWQPLSAIQKVVFDYVTARGQEATDKFFWKNAKAIYGLVDRIQHP